MEALDNKIQESKELIGTKIPCTLEVLTPVHIGSGVKLSNGIDFLSDRNSTTIVTQAELMKYLEDNPEELDAFTAGGYKLSSLKRCPPGFTFSIQNTRIFEIFEFEKDGNGNPYIPGSSLKGAIRTIIIKNLFEQLLPEKQSALLSSIQNSRVYKEGAADSLVKELLGNDSNHNLMRMIQVFDITFSSTDISKVFLLSLTNSDSTSYGWKKFAKGMPNVSLKDNPTALIIESLPIGAKSNFSFHIDDFLSKNELAKKTLKFKIINVAELSALINNHSKIALIKERDFFSKINSSKTLTAVTTEIDNLLALIPKPGSPEESKEFVIRISWGAGWKGMTGDFINNNWIDIIRKKYQQGKVDRDGNILHPAFPKTRKIVFDGDTPKYLTGWVKIKLNDRIINKKKQNTIVVPKIDDSDWAAKLGQNYKIRQNKKK
ncbi:MAG: putative RAMP superfamily DNA repair protein [Ignavibacteria bacterium]|nr:MAG: putative RAMP superfamily DNA repair protein [Ignavibacteria bacterium]KAF0158113.1 MAG: putative RAMP superfamily DNA repair protein [Ignavibacteria bacterium]